MFNVECSPKCPSRTCRYRIARLTLQTSESVSFIRTWTANEAAAHFVADAAGVVATEVNFIGGGIHGPRIVAGQRGAGVVGSDSAIAAVRPTGFAIRFDPGRSHSAPVDRALFYAARWARF